MTPGRSGYTYRRIAQTMQAPTPVQTPDTDAATVYDQRWKRQDGMQSRAFTVLALDEEMAQELGGLRLSEKYDQNPMQWTLEVNRPCERMTSMIYAVLAAETPDETKVREDGFSRLTAGDANPFEARG